MMNARFFTDPAAFMKTAFDPSNIIHQVRPLGATFETSEMVYTTFTKEEDFVDILPNTNVVLAAFTTSSARLKLYSYLEKLQERVLYFDTDSIIYLSRPGDEYEAPIGSFLGDLTDELEDYGEGAYIDKFIGAGPKNYLYRVRKPDGSTESKMKVRGFTSSHQMACHLNEASLTKKVKRYLKNRINEKTTIVRGRIERRPDRQVVTADRKKDYQIVYDKRWIRKNGDTLPYGFCE